MLLEGSFLGNFFGQNCPTNSPIWTTLWNHKSIAIRTALKKAFLWIWRLLFNDWPAEGADWCPHKRAKVWEGCSKNKCPKVLTRLIPQAFTGPPKCKYAARGHLFGQFLRPELFHKQSHMNDIMKSQINCHKVFLNKGVPLNLTAPFQRLARRRSRLVPG